MKHVEFINNKAEEIQHNIMVDKTGSFETHNVVFFLLAQRRHFKYFSDRANLIGKNWEGQNAVLQHSSKSENQVDKISHGEGEAVKISEPAVLEPIIHIEVLGKWKRSIDRLIRHLELKNPINDPVPRGLVGRIRRLSRHHCIQRYIAALMIAITEARNIAEHEHKTIIGPQAVAVKNSWEAVLNWARDEGLDVT